jgi:outer membrane receptor for ferrienterochelin and colicins
MELPRVYDLGENGLPLSEPRPTRSPITGRHNLQIQWNLAKAWTVSAGVQNLFDELQAYSPLTGYNDPSAPAGFSPYFDTSYAYATGHGREYFLGLRFEIAQKPSERP